MRKFGLIGRHISYSFSRGYFQEKFQREQIAASYENFDLEDLSVFPELIEKNSQLVGLNVTIPYKEKIIPYLDRIDPVAAEIGAVNTIRIDQDGTLEGYNTDYFGFREAIRPYLRSTDKNALILGTGGASKAIHYALHSLGIDTQSVSRTPSKTILSYHQLDEQQLQSHQLIINCTPLGTSPRVEKYPPVPIRMIGTDHLVFDLIYNPPMTQLLSLASQQGARISNGQKMLELQAEKAWEIWNSPPL